MAFDINNLNTDEVYKRAINDPGIKALLNQVDSSNRAAVINSLNTRREIAGKQQAFRRKFKLENDAGKALEFDDKGNVKRIKINSTKGRRFDELAPEVKKVILEAEDAAAEAERLGKKKEKKQGAFMKVIDVISRPIYGVAEGVNDIFEENDRQKYEEKQGRDQGNFFQRALKTVGAGAKGVGEGVTGKEKTYFSEVLQREADRDLANDVGADPLQAEYGSAKLNPFVKYGVGLAADIALDPTTYLGLGTVGKTARVGGEQGRVIKGSLAGIKDLEGIATVLPKLNAGGKTADEVAELQRAVAVRAPIEVIKKRHIGKLSPEAKRVYDTALAERKALGPRAYDRAYRKKNGANAGFGKKLTVGSQKGKSIAQEIDRLPDAIYNAARVEERTKAATKLVNSGQVPRAAIEKNAKVGITDIFTNLGTQSVTVGGKASGNSVPAALLRTAPYDREWLGTLYNLGTKGIGKNVITKGEIARALPAKGTAKVASNKVVARTVQALESAGVFEKVALPGNVTAYRVTAGMTAKDVEKAVIQFGEKRFNETLKLRGAPAGAPVGSGVFPSLAMLSQQAGKKTLSNTAVAKLVNDMADAGLAARGIHSAEAIREELIASVLTTDAVVRSVAIRVGTKRFTVPNGLANLTVRGKANISSPESISRSIKGFNDVFRATAFMPAGLMRVKNGTAGVGNEITRWYGKELQQVWDKIPKHQRKHIFEMWQKGTILGATTIRGGVTTKTFKEVDNLAKYFDDEIRNMQQTFDDLGMSVDHLNRWLPAPYQIKASDVKQTPKRLPDGRVATIEDYVVQPDRILNHLRKTTTNGLDPAKALFFYSTAINKVVAGKTFRTQVSAQFGVPLKTSASAVGGTGIKGDQYTSRLASSLKRQGYREVKGVPDLKGVIFQPEMAVAIERMHEIFFKGQGQVDGFLASFDKVQQSWKSLVTRGTPSFYVRTLLGEVIMGQMGGMRNVAGSYKDAARVLQGRNAGLFEDAVGAGLPAAANASKKEINIANVLTGQGSTGAREMAASNPTAKVVKTNKYGSFTADEIWHYYLESGLKSSFASTDLVRGTANTRGGAVVAKASDKSQALLESVEDIGRVAHFVDVIKYSKANTLQEALDEAAELVSKYHLDYTAVTKTEQRGMARLIPFYKWMRLSTPLMVDILLTQPGKAATVPKTLAAVSGAAGYDTANGYGVFPGGVDAVVPDYLQNHGAMPIGEMGGVTQWFDPQAIFPLVGAAEAGPGGTGLQGQLRSLSPLIKTPFDVLQNKNSSFEGPTTLRTDENGEFDLGKLTKYLATLTPQTQLTSQLVNPTDPEIPAMQRLFQFLANPGIQPNTERRMLGQATEDRRKLQILRRQAREESGLSEDEIQELINAQAKKSKQRNLDLGITQPR